MSLQSFFSMNMFTWPEPVVGTIASPLLYVYFVVTIPLTLMVYVAWILWFRFSQKRFKKDHVKAVSDFEKELKNRVRTTTETW